MLKNDIEFLKKRRRRENICKISLLLITIVGFVLAVKLF